MTCHYEHVGCPTGHPSIIKLDDGRYHVLLPIRVYTRFNKWVTVPPGFKFDGYTGMPDMGTMKPAAVHDWLYRVHRFDNGDKCTRRQSDIVLYDMLRAEFGLWCANISYLFVRLFGRIHYKNRGRDGNNKRLF